LSLPPGGPPSLHSVSRCEAATATVEVQEIPARSQRQPSQEPFPVFENLAMPPMVVEMR
jgi:hypothetical protein